MAMLGGECSGCCGGWKCVKSCVQTFRNSLPLFDGIEVNIPSIETDTGPLGLRWLADANTWFGLESVVVNWIRSSDSFWPPVGITFSRSSGGGKPEWSLQRFSLEVRCMRGNSSTQRPPSIGNNYLSLFLSFFYGSDDNTEGIFIGIQSSGMYYPWQAHYIGDANALCEGDIQGVLQTHPPEPRFVLRYLTGEVSEWGTPIIAHRDLSSTVDGMITARLYRS